MSGTLFIVATPIGNLEDITYRAVRTLKECDVIACEDTRQTRKLLDHYGIQQPVLSLHEHNEADRIPEVLDRIRAGEKVALVSDAGTPLISDPGYRLVAVATEQGIPVVPIPGVSAITAALSAAGLPTDSFFFGGFLPARGGPRRTELELRQDDPHTLVYYEAPHRILETLEDIAVTLPERPVVVARELTKMHEEFLRGTPSAIATELRSRPAIKGEITLLLGKPDKETTVVNDDAIRQAVDSKIAAGASKKDAMKAVAKDLGLSKSEIYRILIQDQASS